MKSIKDNILVFGGYEVILFPIKVKAKVNI